MEKEIKDSIKKRIKDYRIETYNKNRKEHKPSGKWNASMLGSCMRKQYWKRQNIEPTNPPDVDGIGKMKMGKYHEEQQIQEFKDAGMNIDWEQEPVEYDDVVGLIDCRWKDKDEIIELKSQQAKSFWWGVKQGTMLKKSHQWQLALYLMAKKKKKGRVVYINKETNTVEECGVDLTPELIAKIQDRIKELNNYWNKKELPPALEKDSENIWECSKKWCDYFDKCQEEQQETNKMIDDITSG